MKFILISGLSVPIKSSGKITFPDYLTNSFRKLKDIQTIDLNTILFSHACSILILTDDDYFVMSVNKDNLEEFKEKYLALI